MKAKHKTKELPDALHPGDLIMSESGTTIARIAVTKAKNVDGKRLYKLRYIPSNVTSPVLFTRDELHFAGCRLLLTNKEAT
jgi:hypothetical protein